ncbi:MFS transporter [Paraburkholderia sp. NMBU_R16]|uniref:MFS transporter n=1 Tax=Paraburkholderia sp. NMBU_R16 TaxID=2698676 RepID=UPI001565A6C8|nr:MFS transporter [Paraburkholderia sp. NMBU_R16]NRO96276.1 MFS transporter [Paraburkholderia sp. NMBU_R16]
MTTNDGNSPAGYLDRWRLLNAWVTMYVVGADLFIMSPLLPSMANALHVNVDSAGWLVSGFSIAYAVASPLMGRISDRYGRRRTICWGLLAFAAANLGTVCASSFTLALLSRIFAGISVSAISPSIYAAVGDAAPEGRRAHWISIAVSGLLTALWTSAPLGALLAHVMPWRAVFILLSAAAFVLAWPNLRLWPSSKSAGGRASRMRVPLRAAVSAVSPMVAWGAALYGLYTYLGTGLTLNTSLSASAVSLCFIGWGVGAILGNHLGGWGADKIGIHFTAIASLCGMALAMWLLGLGLSGAMGGGVLAATLCLLALVSYPFQPAQQTRLVQWGQSTKASLLAWNSSALYLGMTIGSAFDGYVMKHWSFNALPYAGMAIAAAGAALSLIAQSAFRSDAAVSAA